MHNRWKERQELAACQVQAPAQLASQTQDARFYRRLGQHKILFASQRLRPQPVEQAVEDTTFGPLYLRTLILLRSQQEQQVCAAAVPRPQLNKHAVACSNEKFVADFWSMRGA